MNKTLVFSSLGVIALLGAVGWAIGSDGHEREGHEYGERRGFFVDASMHTQDPVYQAECGGCHLAFPPGLLPATSWQRIMTGLQDHYGDNASLDAATVERIGNFLQATAADANGWGRSSRIARSLEGREPPMRITETTYFRRHHEEIPGRLVLNNPDVGSYSRCEACHQGAARGDFNEHAVRIPGVGRWHD